MFNVGDYVLHETTGKFGQVFGYGHEIVNNVFLPTLKVRVVRETGTSKGSIVEDLSSEWVRVEEEGVPEFLSKNQFCYLLQDAA